MTTPMDGTAAGGQKSGAHPSSARNNNLVAETDLNGALKGIENRLSELKQDWQEPAEKPGTAAATTDSSSSDGHKEQLDNETRETLQELLTEAERSLPEHVRRIVRPVTDEEFHAHVRRHDSAVEEEEEESQSSDDEVEETEEEYDEEALLDQVAVERARELRTQVRETAERVRALRDSVSNRAVAIAKQEVELVIGSREQEDGSQAKSFDPEAFEEKFRQPMAEDVSKKSAKLQEMEQSLASLMTALDKMDLDLPESMEALQETVETIEEALERRKGGEASLSQTERAIISNENEGGGTMQADASVLETSESTAVAPDKRLALFLSKS